MKRTPLISVIASTLLLCAAPGQSQSGGQFDLLWSSIGAGGGISEAGGYKIASAVGQPLESQTSSDLWNLQSGFLQSSDLFPLPVTLCQFSVE